MLLYLFKLENSVFCLLEPDKINIDYLWEIIESENWNGKKENYRLTKQKNGNYLLESNLKFNRPCNWRIVTSIRDVSNEEEYQKIYQKKHKRMVK